MALEEVNKNNGINQVILIYNIFSFHQQKENAQDEKSKFYYFFSDGDLKRLIFFFKLNLESIKMNQFLVLKKMHKIKGKQDVSL
ncbi:hypothetical protein LB467_18440 [Salegentibacter sp. JZCK2]|uniref:hypothetical protein n=1 Tax=Salegentibacter tibetensis TaxID=2873600 RepID=UPI001CCFF926|nr:hypothetical protein [Salegentibacter tibetensis]MBZ9731667.1 hypothetical protein [Salegentibacter tibetensis]